MKRDASLREKKLTNEREQRTHPTPIKNKQTNKKKEQQQQKETKPNVNNFPFKLWFWFCRPQLKTTINNFPNNSLL